MSDTRRYLGWREDMEKFYMGEEKGEQERLTKESLVIAIKEVDRLRAAIRQHRDERGDDRCHADDGRLYAVLPEGDTRPKCETAVTIENCQKYIECRQTGREYISPQRKIEELEAEVASLKQQLSDIQRHPIGTHKGPVLWCNLCGNPTLSLLNHVCGRT